MSRTYEELVERATQKIYSDIEIYNQLNTTQFDKGIDLFEIYSECYDISHVSHKDSQIIFTNIEQEIDEEYEEKGKIDALNQLQLLVQQILNQNQSELAQKYYKPNNKATIADNSKLGHQYQEIITTSNELIVFLERNIDFNKIFKIQNDQLDYLRLIQDSPQYLPILKQGLHLLTDWLVAMCYKFKINKKINIQTQTLPKTQYQANVILEFVLIQNDVMKKKKIQNQQKITETLLADSFQLAEILSEGFTLSKLTNILTGSFYGGFREIGQWIKEIRYVSSLNLCQKQKT